MKFIERDDNTGFVDCGWHTVQQEIFIFTDNSALPKMSNWCNTNVSSGGYFYNYLKFCPTRVWYFELEEDALMFTLMWG